MIILFWVIMGLLFIQCFRWTVASFLNHRTADRVHIEVKNSFNRYGGREYGTKNTEQEESNGDDYEEIYRSAIKEGKRW